MSIQDSKETSNSVEAVRCPEVDWFLALLVGQANSSGLEMGITLQVAGAIVSGTLVGGGKYFKGLAAAIAKRTDSEVGVGLAEGIASAARLYDDTAEKPSEPVYIHLREARYMDAAGNKTSPTDTWWRGRLSEVAGFHVGTFG